MPAVIEATRNLGRRAIRPETPARLRLWVILAMVTAAALLAATSLLMSRVQAQVRIIGDVSAPQAATASDLYFALSDMDAQVARLVLVGDTDTLAGTQLDALGSYRQRSGQVDADLQRSLTTTTGTADRAIVLAVLDDLAVYRERVWQTLTTPTATDKHGYYTQATNVLHRRLLPSTQLLRDASQQQLDQAYASKRTTEGLGVSLTVGLGVALLLLLLILQLWLGRRFRRVLNPALLAATVITVALVVPAAVIFSVQEQRLGDAQDRSFTPFLALSQARAISYDAAADTSRYLISANLGYYRQDFTRKSACLVKGGSCGAGGEAVDGGLAAVSGSQQVLDRWQAYQRDHKRIVALADNGQPAAAITALTGIRRGDAAFDFSYYDAAVDQIAAPRKAAFDAAVHNTETLLTGWVVIPLVTMGMVILLVPIGVRRRFAEYR